MTPVSISCVMIVTGTSVITYSTERWSELTTTSVDKLSCVWITAWGCTNKYAVIKECPFMNLWLISNPGCDSWFRLCGWGNGTEESTRRGMWSVMECTYVSVTFVGDDTYLYQKTRQMPGITILNEFLDPVMDKLWKAAHMLEDFLPQYFFLYRIYPQFFTYTILNSN